jgi:DamX protein
MPTGSDEELAQPSVIVDMPEVASGGGKKKLLAVVGIVGALAAIGIVAFLVLGGEKEPPKEPPKPPAEVTITIKVSPSSAVVNVDGKRVSGDPPMLTVAPSDAPHTVKAKADGYESLEKDVKFDATKTIELQLIEVVAPSGEVAPPAAEPVVAPAEPAPPAKAAKPAPPAKATKPTPPAKPAAKPAPADKPAAKPAPADKPKAPAKKKGGFDTSNPYG